MFPIRIMAYILRPMSDIATDAIVKDESPWSRYVPLLIWLIAAVSVLFIPMGIVGQGFIPPDDAMRHVGKVLSGKDWKDIMVLRPGVDIDHNAGWHAILTAVHHLTGWGADGLISFSVIALCWLFLLAPLLQTPRPEAWLAAVLAAMVAAPFLVFRFVLGRPYIFVMATFMTIILQWLRRGEREPGWMGLTITSLAIAVAAWIHGGWYLYWIPAAGFFLAQRWRQGFALTACWLAGSFLAGVFTGHPIFFLTQQLDVLLSCFGHHTVQRVLVIEFKPFDGVFASCAIIAVLLARIRRLDDMERATLKSPLFMMVVMCWIFGFIVRRFWLDWGMPAFLLWTMLQLTVWFEDLLEWSSLNRLIATGMLSGATLLCATADIESRWTSNLTNEYLDAKKPEMAAWLPDPGGIIYNDNMAIFYQTFFHNPQAPWRYILGFEATFMPAEDLETFRKIQWNFGADEAYKPWAAKMRPEDRMILSRGKGAKPAIPELEWNYTATGTWIGRLPRVPATSGTNAPVPSAAAKGP